LNLAEKEKGIEELSHTCVSYNDILEEISIRHFSLRLLFSSPPPHSAPAFLVFELHNLQQQQQATVSPDPLPFVRF
jgi:hypothetical protein